jgi:hypothetical protein
VQGVDGQPRSHAEIDGVADEVPLTPPVFGDGCKVGTSAVVLAGVTIGAHALIGAGSVVTRDVAAEAIVYGVPAAEHGQVTPVNALTWLQPLRSSIPELGPAGWATLERLDTDLQTLCEDAPAASDAPAWSQWLLGLRRDLADRGHHTPPGPSGQVWQPLVQFLAGARDLDCATAPDPATAPWC